MMQEQTGRSSAEKFSVAPACNHAPLSVPMVTEGRNQRGLSGLFAWDWPDMATQESNGADNSERSGWQVRLIYKFQCRKCQRSNADCVSKCSHFITTR
jgi:hypothetical protein